ncbi:MAG TPA: D-alanyl-D-alanine carboxypeptidase [Candidatus Polarisedimenticolaceae bacterium]|nr:D-alanyl-D-alanine carboxypeptidase [Candidatus Polarisedimenticolaceae bacterium]
MTRALTLTLAVVFAATSTGGPADAATGKRRARRPATPPSLVWHVETIDGQVLDSKSADVAINPASVVKVATTWWALERLGPNYRFTTRFEARGTIDPKTGTLKGDLVVRGSGDPDFQAENAFLAAAALRDAGIKTVSGALVVDDAFWMGWENGSQGRRTDPSARGLLMATRMRSSLDARRWTRTQRSAWNLFAARRDLPLTPPSVVVRGGVRYESKSKGSSQVLFEHVSKPLAETLRRFNCFSNNDIERVAASLGPASELSVLLADKLAPGTTPIQIETPSGLGTNRLTPRQIVSLLRTFRKTADERGLPVEGLLPVAGCDPGTVTSGFPRLSGAPYATALVAKTGTLTSTDGGVTVLAGFLNTAEGEVVFCVAAPHAAGKIRLARRTEESFLLDVIGRRGGALPRTCAAPLATADEGSTIVGATGAAAPLSATQASR